MTRALAAVPVVLLASASLVGCSVSPAERAATEKAWEERDAQRAAECAQKRGRWIAGTCTYGGGA